MLLASTVALAAGVEPIRFERETLGNGLRVIYAPMDNAPVVHVRVLYHVGSRDERPDRQGFAHLFEHMMFRGSAHVKPEEHMNLINRVGGISNAFTSFDQTTYVNTVPSNHLEMALWLEADRMASFKVTDEIFKTERNVVAEEWRLRYANQPYGTMFQDVFRTAFNTHNYRWMPIGDMDQLAQSTTEELQAFHDKYYVPNNAVLVIAGQFDVNAARAWVNKYFGWIPAGRPFTRATRPEPEQTEPRKTVVYRETVPVARLMIAYKTPAYTSDDHLALELLGTVLGSGRSSRLYQALVGGDDPVAVGAQSGNYQLQDPSLFAIVAVVLPGKDPDVVVERINDTIARLIEGGITSEELAKAKVDAKLSLIGARQTAESVATALAEEEAFGNDADRVNTYFDRLDKLTADDVVAAAKKYLNANTASVVQYRPGKGQSILPPPFVMPSEQVETQEFAREIHFPADYPTTPPINNDTVSKEFAKGDLDRVGTNDVITMTDNRLPMVGMQIIIRGGGHSVGADKQGLADLTAQMLSRGAAGMTAEQIAADLESRGINISASDNGDHTSIRVTALAEQFEYAMARTKQILLQPDFPEAEFNRIKRQAVAGIQQRLSDPGNVADEELDAALFGDSPLGVSTTPASLNSITLDDVKAYYASTYKPANALIVFGGAIDRATSTRLAGEILADWSAGAPPQASYDFPPIPEKPQIILVDNPSGAQAAVRMGIRAYPNSSDDRFAGSVAGQILSAGIDSRLNRVLRAEKGLTYGSYGYFRPGRQGGAFEFSVDTKPESVADAITSAIGVLETMRSSPVEDDELATAQQRVAGLMVLETQTIQQQVGRRIDVVLNGYPIDYYDKYPGMIARVTKDQVQDVMQKYVRPGNMTIVVVAPADAVKAQLEPLGDATVVKMPLAR